SLPARSSQGERERTPRALCVPNTTGWQPAKRQTGQSALLSNRGSWSQCMRKKRKGAFHEPYPLTPSLSPSGVEGFRRTESRRFMVPMHTEKTETGLSTNRQLREAPRHGQSHIRDLPVCEIFGIRKTFNLEVA